MLGKLVLFVSVCSRGFGKDVPPISLHKTPTHRLFAIVFTHSNQWHQNFYLQCFSKWSVMIAAFETLEEFLAVTSELTRDTWTGAYPTGSSNPEWYVGIHPNQVEVHNIAGMWDPEPPPASSPISKMGVFDSVKRKLIAGSSFGTFTTLCEKYPWWCTPQHLRNAFSVDITTAFQKNRTILFVWFCVTMKIYISLTSIELCTKSLKYKCKYICDHSRCKFRDYMAYVHRYVQIMYKSFQ